MCALCVSLTLHVSFILFILFNIDPTKANSEEDLLIHAMASLPSEYDHLVPHLEEDLPDMTVEKLKQKLRPVFLKTKEKR